LKAGFVAQREPTAKKRQAPTEIVPPPITNNVHWDAPPEGVVQAPDPKRQRREQNTDRGGSPSEINTMLQHHRTEVSNEENPQEGQDRQPLEPEVAQTQEPERRNSSRKPQPVEGLIKVMLVKIKDATRHNMEGEIFCLEAMFPSREEIENPLVAYKATSGPDTMYLHEAIGTGCG
jgi:hypothetical protein